jgi:DNA end-binding protein Ku
LLHSLLWPDEIRSPAGIAPGDVALRPKEVKLVRTLMDAITADFHIEDETDEYNHALDEVVQARLAGIEPPHAPQSRVLPPGGTDLVALLESALADAQGRHPKTGGGVKSTSRTGRPVKKTPARKSATRGTSPRAPENPPTKRTGRWPAGPPSQS